MEIEPIDKSKYAIIRGFADAKDSQGRSVSAAFISVSSFHETIFFRQIFSYEPIDREMEWADLLALLEREANIPPSDATIAHYMAQFAEYVDMQRVFEYGRSRLEDRELERKVSEFFMSTLGLRAILFLEITIASESDVLSLLPSLADTADDEPQEGGGEDAGSEDGSSEPGTEDAMPHEDGEIYLSCNPVLDPVGGVAVGELMIGSSVMVHLPEDSMYCQFLTSRLPDFNGIIDGEVTGVKMDEFGAANVAVKIADGVFGAMRLSESVRIKRGSEGAVSFGSGPGVSGIAVLFAAFSVILLIIVICGLVWWVDF